MFTGIVSDVGRVSAIERRDGLLRLTVDSAYEAAGMTIGASICHDGVCLTLVEIAPRAIGARYLVEIAAESLAKTTLGALDVGDPINLERALKAGDELGGHLVMGHVDGVGRVRDVRADGEGRRITIAPPTEIARLIAPKGSISINGVSLTVNEANDENFGVLIIPHTLAVTTLGRLKTGDLVNLEADTMARYARRLLEGVIKDETR